MANMTRFSLRITAPKLVLAAIKSRLEAGLDPDSTSVRWTELDFPESLWGEWSRQHLDGVAPVNLVGDNLLIDGLAKWAIPPVDIAERITAIWTEAIIDLRSNTEYDISADWEHSKGCSRQVGGVDIEYGEARPFDPETDPLAAWHHQAPILTDEVLATLRAIPIPARGSAFDQEKRKARPQADPSPTQIDWP